MNAMPSLPPARSARPVAPERIDLLFSADAGYFQHIAVAATSVSATSRHPHIHVHLMTCDRDPAAEARLARSLAACRNLTLHVHHVADDRLDAVFVDSYLTKETYLRFFAGDVLPPEVSRVVYLDGDLVVMDDIAELYATDLHGKVIAGAPELDWWGGGDRLARLGIVGGHRYFNAGVLVIDLDRWRREGVRDKLFAYALARGSDLECHDQDVLNAVLQHEAVALDRRWNVETLWYSGWVRRTFPRDFAELRPALARPGIVHYSTVEKPWKFRAWTRRRGIYFHHLAKTAWRGETPRGLTALQRAEYRISRDLLRVGVEVNALVSLRRHAAKLFGRLRRDRGAPATRAPGSSPRGGAEPIDVLFCADRGYLPHVATAAASVAESSPGRALRFHLITCDAPSEAEEKLRAGLRRYPAATLAIHRVEGERLDRLFVDRHVTREAYLRFLAPEMLPAEVDRVIYLDVDLVVLDDIAHLRDADLAGKAVGAVPEVDWAEAAPDARAAALGLAPGHRYVNSGVLVIDLARWRRDGLGPKLLDCAAALGPRATYFDQDALNVALQGDIALLDRRWNVQTLMLGGWYRTAMPKDWSATAAARRAPGIVHFSTGAKPWRFRARTRRRADWFRFRDLTPWRDAPPPELNAAERIEHRLARGLLRAGIDVYLLAGAGERLRAALGRAVARQPGGKVGGKVGPAEDARP